MAFSEVTAQRATPGGRLPPAHRRRDRVPRQPQAREQSGDRDQHTSPDRPARQPRAWGLRVRAAGRVGQVPHRPRLADRPRDVDRPAVRRVHVPGRQRQPHGHLHRHGDCTAAATRSSRPDRTGRPLPTATSIATSRSPATAPSPSEVTSLTGLISTRPPDAAPRRSRPPGRDWRPGPRPASCVTPSTRQGSAYAAVMATGSHGAPLPIRLHPRPDRSTRSGHERVAAVAAADPHRRHDHRLRLDQRNHAGTRSAPHASRRTARDRRCRAVRHLTCHLPGLQRRRARPKPPPPSTTSAWTATA